MMDEGVGVASVCAIGDWEGSDGGTGGMALVILFLSWMSIYGAILSMFFVLIVGYRLDHFACMWSRCMVVSCGG